MHLDLPLLRLLAVGICVATLSQSTTAQDKPADEVPGTATPASFESPVAAANEKYKKHPLWPALQLAEDSLDWIDENVRDYTCEMVRRERVGGILRPYEYGELKIRHQQTNNDEVTTPFSAYVHFTNPSNIAGREVLFVEGKHAGRMYVKRGGRRLNQLTAFVKPTSAAAMRENRYPITEIGFRNMAVRLIKVIRSDLDYDEVEVQFFKNAKVADRVCTRIEVVHPVPRDHLQYHKAMVFVDDEKRLPIGFASFDWPEEEGDQPRLLEEYVFTNVELNVGLTDADFEKDNPNYGFNRYNETE